MVRSILIGMLVMVLRISFATDATAQEGDAEMPKARLGVVTLNFADGSAGHYKNAFPILKKYGLKGNFDVCVGKLGGGHMTAEQLVELYKDGQEIRDHTFLHQAAVWGDPKQEDEWIRQTEASLKAFKDLGIKVHGWWQPGGEGAGYPPELQRLLHDYYEYAFPMAVQRGPKGPTMHWNFYNDPYIVRAVGNSWEGAVAKIGADMKNITRADAEKAVAAMKAKIADCVQQGVLISHGFHGVEERKHSIWALEELCKFIKGNNLPNMTYFGAFRAFQNPRKHYPEGIEQMPNAGFRYDIDGNGRPDGYERCSFAPKEIKSPAGGKVAEIRKGTGTRIYGPEPGASKFSYWIRSADGKPRAVTPTIELTTIDETFKYGEGSRLRFTSALVPSEWKEISFTFNVSDRTEWADIRWTVKPDGPVYLAAPSFKRAVQTGGHR